MTGTEKWARPTALIDRWEGFVPGILTAIAAVLYFLTLAPTVGHTDAGELSAVAYTYGVAHPTGYPLFTLLGWLFSRIPMGSVAFRLNLMCMLFVTGSVYVWARFLREFFIQMRTTVKKGDSSYAFRIKLANLVGTVVGTLFLVFGRTWWTQATGTEVYSLQTLLLGLMLWALLRAWWEKESIFLRWAIFTVALALCFTNHLTAIVLLPGVIYIYIAKFRVNAESVKRALGLVGVGLAVLVLFYGSLLLVAASQPQFNWGNPQDWSRLWHHMSGKQFSVYMFLGPKAFGVNLLDYLNRLPSELGWDLIWPKIPIWIGLGAMVFQGMSYCFERRREWAIFFGLGFFSNIFWAANYSIKDPEPYFLLSFMVVAFLGAMVARWSWINAKRFAPFISAGFGVVLAFQVFWNYGAVNQRGNYQYEDYARATLSSLAPNAIVISRSWDVLVSPSYYLQGCEGLRPDVTLVEYQMLHDRHWYPAQLRAQDPALATALGDRLSAWEKAVAKFDLKGIVNPAELGPRFDALWAGITAMAATRPVYIGPEIFDGIVQREIAQPQGLMPVPEAYLIRLVPAPQAQNYLPAALPATDFRMGGDPLEYESKVLRRQAAQVWAMRANYEGQTGHADLAKVWGDKATAIAPPPDPKED